MVAWEWMSCGYATYICQIEVPVKWGPESATLGLSWAPTARIGAFQLIAYYSILSLDKLFNGSMDMEELWIRYLQLSDRSSG